MNSKFIKSEKYYKNMKMKENELNITYYTKFTGLNSPFKR